MNADYWGVSMEEAIEVSKKMAEYSYVHGTSAVEPCSHAYGYNTKATGFCSHAEGCNTKASGLRNIEPSQVSSSHEVPTTDILEKIQREIEEWLGDPGMNCQANLKVDLF